jgi:hypothetical protein
MEPILLFLFLLWRRLKMEILQRERAGAHGMDKDYAPTIYKSLTSGEEP